MKGALAFWAFLSIGRKPGVALSALSDHTLSGGVRHSTTSTRAQVANGGTETRGGMEHPENADRVALSVRRVYGQRTLRTVFGDSGSTSN